MIFDFTTLVTSEGFNDTKKNLDRAAFGHLGTHFDVMNKTFPLEFTERKGIIFDISSIIDRDIEINDIDITLVKNDMFVAFYSGYIEKVPYGAAEYFKGHPQLSKELIEVLLEKGISIIGVDFAGVRSGKEHPVMDQYCADRGVFIVENLCNLKSVLKDNKNATCMISTYPINFDKMSGLPCRVVARI